MESLETLIVAKAVKAKDASKASSDVDPGTYVFDFLVRLTGKIRRGEDHETILAHTPKYALLAMFFASKVNQETFDAVLREYSAAIESGDFSDIEKQFKENVKPAVAGLARKGLVNGKTTTNLNCEVVGEASITKEELKKTG